MSVNALSGGHHCRGEWKVPGSMNSCNIITLDYRVSGEPVCGAWLAHHHPRRTGWTPLRRNSGKLSCLSARPPDLAVLAGARPQVLVVLPSSVPHLTVKRAARRRAPVQKMWSLWRSESFVSVSLYEVAELPQSDLSITQQEVIYAILYVRIRYYSSMSSSIYVSTRFASTPYDLATHRDRQAQSRTRTARVALRSA